MRQKKSKYILSSFIFALASFAMSTPQAAFALTPDCETVSAWGAKNRDIRKKKIRTSVGRLPELLFDSEIEDVFGKPVTDWSEADTEALEDHLKACRRYSTDMYELGIMVAVALPKAVDRYRDKLGDAIGAQGVADDILKQADALPVSSGSLALLKDLFEQADALERRNKERVIGVLEAKRSEIVATIVAGFETDLADLPTGYDGLVSVHQAYTTHLAETKSLLGREGRQHALVAFAAALNERSDAQTLSTFRQSIAEIETLDELKEAWGNLAALGQATGALGNQSAALQRDIAVLAAIRARVGEIESAESVQALQDLRHDFAGLKQAVSFHYMFLERARRDPTVYRPLLETSRAKVTELANSIRAEQCVELIEDIKLRDNAGTPVLLGNRIVPLSDLYCVLRMSGVQSLGYMGPGLFNKSHTIVFTKEDVETKAIMEMVEINDGNKALVPTKSERAGEVIDVTRQEWIDSTSAFATLAGVEACGIINFSQYRFWKSNDLAYQCFIRNPIARMP